LLRSGFHRAHAATAAAAGTRWSGVLAVAAGAVLAGASDGITDDDIDLAKRVGGLV
jgi:hypothetical protein